MSSPDIHPDLRLAAKLFPRRVALPRSLAALRAVIRVSGLVPVRGARTVVVNDEVSVRVHLPKNLIEPSPALLWIHGGGYVMGTARQDDFFCRKLARTAGLPVVSVDYRLAPEHPYPAAIEDCYAALRWLSVQGWVDPTRIAIGGASAGGGLTAALALLARDRGEVAPALQLLVYPMLDDRTSTRTDIDETNLRMWSTDANRFGWDAYLADADRDIAVPGRQMDLSGLAPAWLGIGTADLFHDEGIAYAERLRAAGVPCELEIVPGAFHGFDRFAPRAGVSKDFVAKACRSLQGALI
ncbi:alpha/beta hydrolase [Mycobacterium sp. CBMA271]|uniref:alpha/beta hydrolase n=1 Tax=unclassified Mycobacteroides TaxID=2618759 RepID=UPI001321D05C|nr:MULTISPECIES: alpha/beta hydrolase [unclassified Mycobacteroides]MUM15857.1 alpha/beta hydrolase [Mycobacteroides sp. CBMA 326]MUM24468.1 alpha/beta hydrolase [Mycobacteroides sp. CBMA 271]